MGNVGHFLRTRVGPWVIWLATMTGAVLLYFQLEGRTDVVGFARTLEHRVSATRTARVASVAVDIGQHVGAGQVIATLEVSDIAEQLQLEQAEIARLRAEADAVRARAGADANRDRLRAAAGSASIVRDRAAARATLAARQGELRAVKQQLVAERRLLADKLADRSAVAALEVRHGRLRREVSGIQAQLEVLDAQAAPPATSPPGPLDATDTPLGDVLAGPFERRIDAAKARIAHLHAQERALVLRAAAPGRVAAVLRRAGDVVRPGEPIVTVVTADDERVIACLREDQALAVREGASATLRPRGGGELLPATVESLGPIVDEVPVRCRRNPREPAWGRDVILRLDAPRPLLAGQAFDVRIETKQAEGAHAASRTTANATGTHAYFVPDALTQLSRLEPSGLVWLPSLRRYLVVSDDTGHKHRNEHAPWVFTVDARGRFDPAAFPLRGVDSLNDLESIARTSDGRLYLLASNSSSKKGRRKPARTRMHRARLTGRELIVESHVALFPLLEALSTEQRAALGLGDLDQLDIEGMTAWGEGLLLGLKRPISAQGALLWHVANPDALLQGDLAAAGLTKLAALHLRLPGNGKAAGICELLGLPDGTLWVAGTDDTDGAIWRVQILAGRPPALELVTAFDGLKPEGLALSSRPGYVHVAFDRGSETPHWLEVPWSR